jgi:citrate lyase subunit beta / citryl-CoA lyase
MAALDPPPRRVLRLITEFASSLRVFGKSAVHPRQLPARHDVFTAELERAETVLDAFDAAGGEAVKLQTANS